MNQRLAEVTVGVFILAGLISLAVLAIQVSGLSSYVKEDEHYMLVAHFDNIGDLKPRAPVSIAGVTIGRVKNISLDPESYRAKVTLDIRKSSMALPIDTSAYIFTEGLLGSNYISLVPGFGVGDALLKSGDMIETTYSALILEDLIGKLLFKLSNGAEAEA